MAVNSPFFNKFPKFDYNMNFGRGKFPITETVTNIFFRLGIIKEALNNITSYEVYQLESGDTPEIVAERVYNDAGAGWIVIYANQLADPQFEWPLTYDQFNKYIVKKYGSIENAETGIHHSEMIVTRTNSEHQVVSETRFQINTDRLTDTMPPYRFNYYNAHAGDGEWDYDIKTGQVPVAEGSVGTYEIDGATITESIVRNQVSYYEYEERLNESRRVIKVIKAEYYPRIMSEFKNLTGTKESYLRKVK